MPLQGHLSRHRSFQSMSPIEMIGATLAGDRRPIFATLHPKETYAEADLQALERLERAFPRFRVSRAGSDRLLAWCDMVVTQNSSLAFRGYLIEKPAVLFAGADFHHIAGSVPRDGLDDAFHLARETAPAFAAYVWWFWVRHAINAGSPDAEQQIRQRLASHGWPVA